MICRNVNIDWDNKGEVRSEGHFFCVKGIKEILFLLNFESCRYRRQPKSLKDKTKPLYKNIK
jgi:hypothetical protein